MNSINDIKNELKEYKLDSLGEFISKYSSDERSGVKALVKKAEKQIKDYENELERIKKLSFYENKYSEYNRLLRKRRSKILLYSIRENGW